MPAMLDTAYRGRCFVAKNNLMATIPKTRQMTICNKGFARKGNCYVSFPEIRLTGKWLQESGFRSGRVIDIACEDGKLIITIAKEQRFDDI